MVEFVWKLLLPNSKDFILFNQDDQIVIMQSASHTDPLYAFGVRLQSTEDRDIKFKHVCFSNKTYVSFSIETENIKKSQRLPFELTVRFSVELMFFFCHFIQWVPIWVTFQQQQRSIHRVCHAK